MDAETAEHWPAQYSYVTFSIDYDRSLEHYGLTKDKMKPLHTGRYTGYVSKVCMFHSPAPLSQMLDYVISSIG